MTVDHDTKMIQLSGREENRQTEEPLMASISAVSLSVVTNVANADITVTYSLTGSAFDIASGQPYTEICKLMGDDTGIVPAEDNVDDVIPNGLMTPIFSIPVVFTNALPINRTR